MFSHSAGLSSMSALPLGSSPHCVNKAGRDVVRSYLNDMSSADVNTLFKICTEGIDIPFSFVRFQYLNRKRVALCPSRNLYMAINSNRTVKIFNKLKVFFDYVLTVFS